MEQGRAHFAGASFVQRSWTYLNLFHLGWHRVKKKKGEEKVVLV